MSNFTSKANGNWSTSGQVVWNQVGVPGAGDTVTISHDVTVDVNTTVGNSPNTGGSAVVTMDTNGTTLTVGTGVTFTVQGPIALNGSGYSVASPVVLHMNAGSTLSIKPASGQAYTITGTNNWFIDAAGSSGSHCTIKTDTSSGGLACWMINANFRSIGPRVCTYTDFIDLGTSSHWGVMNWTEDVGFSAVSITNCTFLRCSYIASFPTDSGGATNNFTFTNNIFTSSVAGPNFNGITTCCATFQFSDASASGTYLIQLNSFDLNTGIALAVANKLSVLDNVFGAWISWPGGTTDWTSDSHFARNFIYTNIEPCAIYGPIKDCYLLDPTSTNPHYIQTGASVVAMSYSGLIVESFNSGAGGAGDIITPNAAASSTTLVKDCIVLPDATGLTSGKLLSCLQGSNNVITCEHNTYYSKSGEHGLIGLDEAASSYAGEIASCRGNLIWSATAATGGYAVSDVGAGTPAVDAVTIAGYNGFWNPNTGTCLHNTSTSQSGVVGYTGIKVSGSGAFPNAQIGTGDLTGNPVFVDSTRNLKTWGTTQGADGTVAGAVAKLASNPALIGQATTGLLAWVRAGFAPTNVAFQAASYPGDTSTADAAGTAWPGGAPGIGAVAYTSGTPSASGGAALMMGM